MEEHPGEVTTEQIKTSIGEVGCSANSEGETEAYRNQGQNDAIHEAIDNDATDHRSPLTKGAALQRKIAPR